MKMNLTNMMFSLCTHNFFCQINKTFLFVSSFSKTGLVRHDDPALVPAACHVSVEVDPIRGIATEKQCKKENEDKKKSFFI